MDMRSAKIKVMMKAEIAMTDMMTCACEALFSADTLKYVFIAAKGRRPKR